VLDEAGFSGGFDPPGKLADLPVKVGKNTLGGSK